MRVKQAFFVLIIIFVASACKGPLSRPATGDNKSQVHNVVVGEVIHAGGYTYLKVTEKRKESWLAVPAMEAKKGDKLSYTGGLEMTDFTSKELKRTFPSILFLEGVNMEGGMPQAGPMDNLKSPGALKTEKIDVTIKQGEGCISVAKLFEAKSDYSGKTVKVRGKITKFNPQIMGKNWVHLQDGTDFKGDFDLTITTADMLSAGDTATFEGKISLKKDFGYGYFYEVIMEDGKLIR
jgi:hypothetical protein